MMFIGFLAALLTADFYILLASPPHFHLIIIYWNCSNCLYLLLNLLLHFLVALDTSSCVKYCLLRFCYEDQHAPRKYRTSISNHHIQSQTHSKSQENSQHSSANCFQNQKCAKIGYFFLGILFSLLAGPLTVIIAFFIIKFCFKRVCSGKQAKRSLPGRKRSQSMDETYLPQPKSFVQCKGPSAMI